MVGNEQLADGIGALRLTLSSKQQQTMLDYLQLLSKWNQVFNLSAIRNPDDMIGPHLLDSLALLPFLGSEHYRILDVGSGAGLPGIPLAISCPEKEFVLLDSNGKKTRFLQQVKIDLDLDNVSVMQLRFEDYRPKQNFAIVMCRAFTSLSAFFRVGRGLLDDAGHLFAMKGKRPNKELAELADSEVIDQIVPLRIPFLDAERHLIIAH